MKVSKDIQKIGLKTDSDAIPIYYLTSVTPHNSFVQGTKQSVRNSVCLWQILEKGKTSLLNLLFSVQIIFSTDTDKQLYKDYCIVKINQRSRPWGTQITNLLK